MKHLFAVVAAATSLISSAASAVTLADFQLNGSTANGVGGSIALTDNSIAGLGATGITFGANAGPTITGLGAISVYTLETRFSVDAVSGYRKIVDFFDRASDSGLYNLSGALNFYPVITGPTGQITAGNMLTLTLARDAANIVTGSVNGVQQFTFNDAGNLAVISNTLHFFRDDTAVGGEAATGFVDYIRLADAGGFTATAAIPEPATWAVMIMGFGAAGAMLRRRRAAAAA